MALRDFEINVYDFEVFAHDWLLVTKDPNTGEYNSFWNEEAEDLIQFMEDHADALFVSYNGSHYDQYIMKAIYAGCDPEQVKEVNDWIIAGNQGWEHPYLQDLYWRFNDVDLMKDTQVGTTLKSIEGHLGMSVEESEVDFTITHKLSADERADVLHYCEHDVDATERLLWIREDYLETKMTLGERAGLTPAQSLYLTNAKLTAKVLGATREEHDDERAYEFPKNLNLKRIPLTVLSFFSRVRDKDVPDEELWKSKLDIEVEGCPVTVAFGGIHGAIPKYREEATPDRSIINIDVTSYYPSLMIQNGYTSRNMASPGVFKGIYDERLGAKASGDKPVANSLKLIVNTTYGATLNQYNDLYDPLMARSVCISGQLYLLELAESLVQSVTSLRLVQLNTDGIMVSVDRHEIEDVRAIYHEWESRTGFGLEEDDISVVWQKDVNNYAMRTIDCHEKVKGSYLVRGASTVGAFKINNNATVVADALRAYLLDGTPVEETVMACDDPSKFQLIAKAGSKFSRVYQLVADEEVDRQKCNRVFACRYKGLGRLYKVKRETGQVAKIESLPDHCLVSNAGMPDISEIDKSYYVQLAQKRAADFKEKKMAAATKKTAAANTDYSGMNVFRKLMTARKLIGERALTKTGVNDYDGWTYMELGDIIPAQNEVFAEVGLLEQFTFEPAVAPKRVINRETGEVTETGGMSALATSKVFNVDDPAEEPLTFCLTWAEIEPIVTNAGKKKQNAVQLQGSVQTYLRRYLKMQILDIALPDEIDGSSGAPEKEPAKNASASTTRVATQKRQPVAKKAPTKPATAEERATTAKRLANPNGKATQLQVRQLRKAIRTTMDAHKDVPEVSAYVAQISTETNQLKGEFTKKQAEAYITKLGELKEKYDNEGEE